MLRPNTKNFVVTSTAIATEAPTQTSPRAPSANESESARSAIASGGNGGSTVGSIVGSTLTSDHGSVGSSAATAGVNSEGTSPIATAPSKAILGLGAASVMPCTKAVPPKRQCRHGESATAVKNYGNIDIDPPENSMGNNEATKILGISGLINWIGMAQRAMDI
jgi:hypothetical protein